MVAMNMLLAYPPIAPVTPLSWKLMPSTAGRCCEIGSGLSTSAPPATTSAAFAAPATPDANSIARASLPKPQWRGMFFPMPRFLASPI